MSNMRLHAIVHGRVQGVAFRANAQYRAHRLGLVGWVRNLADGEVETVAVGEKSALEAYADWLRRGPLDAHVTQVEMDWNDTDESYSGFEIRY